MLSTCLLVASSKKQPFRWRDLAVLWPLSRAKLVVFLRVNGNKGLFDPFEISLSRKGVHVSLLREKHDPRNLLPHLLSEVDFLWYGHSWADAGADVRVEFLVESLHGDELFRLEELKHYLNGCAPPKVALVLIVVSWKLN